mgnify:CR=1 FL=1
MSERSATAEALPEETFLREFFTCSISRSLKSCSSKGSSTVLPVQADKCMALEIIRPLIPSLPSAIIGSSRRIAAAKASHAHSFIKTLPNGYDTYIEQGGTNVSGGQKQRAAIARTLVSQTPILIFDDSLSAVDTETDARIRRAISQRFGKATVILISHRITTLSAADKIIVLDKGRITEEGTHEELKNAGVEQEGVSPLLLPKYARHER